MAEIKTTFNGYIIGTFGDLDHFIDNKEELYWSIETICTEIETIKSELSEQMTSATSYVARNIDEMKGIIRSNDEFINLKLNRLQKLYHLKLLKEMTCGGLLNYKIYETKP